MSLQQHFKIHTSSKSNGSQATWDYFREKFLDSDLAQESQAESFLVVGFVENANLKAKIIATMF